MAETLMGPVCMVETPIKSYSNLIPSEMPYTSHPGLKWSLAPSRCLVPKGDSKANLIQTAASVHSLLHDGMARNKDIYCPGLYLP